MLNLQKNKGVKIMQMNKLIYFISVADNLNFTKAAKENNIVVANEKKTKTYEHFLSFYSKYNIVPKSIITAADGPILSLMIDLNMGISIVPKKIKELNNGKVSFVEIEGEPHSIKFSAAYLKGNANPCVDLFINNAAIR